MGNVAVDCARILLSSVDDLAKTDITDIALDTLRQSRIRHVILVGRRGPIQVSFTIKELRELTKLNGVQSMLDKEDFAPIDQSMVDKFERPRKRLTELLLKTARTSLNFPKIYFTMFSQLFILDQSKENTERFWYLKFWRRPKHINGKTTVESVDFEHTVPVTSGNFSDENLSVQANQTVETIPCGLVIKSIGYSGIQVRLK
jgi:adrenodoxin-NADP+ reductase